MIVTYLASPSARLVTGPYNRSMPKRNIEDDIVRAELRAAFVEYCERESVVPREKRSGDTVAAFHGEYQKVHTLPKHLTYSYKNLYPYLDGLFRD